MRCCIRTLRPVSAAILFSAFLPTASLASWVADAIDTASVMGSPVLAIGCDGTPHIAFRHDYYDTSGAPDSADLRYARRVAGTWEIENVADVLPNLVGVFTMALDGAQNPDLVFLRPNAAELTLAVKAAGTWTSEVVELTSPVAFVGTTSISLALDAEDNPVVSYPFGNPLLGRFVRVATRAGGTWTHENAVSAGLNTVIKTSIDVAVDGAPAVAILQGIGLRYAYKSGGAWTVEIVDTGVSSTFLVLDPLDNPHIAYAGPEGVIHAVKSAGAWTLETVDSLGSNPSLALYPDGIPHVAYQTAGGIRHASRAGGVWSITSLCVSGADPWLAFDRTTYAPRLVPAVSFRAPDTLLSYAYPEPTPVPGAPESRGNALLSAFPNPSIDGAIHVRYRIPSGESFALRIFDLTGRRVKTLAAGSGVAENATIPWDGRDEGGRAVASGSYFLRLESERTSATERIVLIR